MYKIYKLEALFNNYNYNKYRLNPLYIDNVQCTGRKLVNTYKDIKSALFYFNRLKGRIESYIIDEEEGELYDVKLYALYDNEGDIIEVSQAHDYVLFEKEFRKLFTQYERKNNVRIEYKFRGDDAK